MLTSQQTDQGVKLSLTQPSWSRTSIDKMQKLPLDTLLLRLKSLFCSFSDRPDAQSDGQTCTGKWKRHKVSSLAETKVLWHVLETFSQLLILQCTFPSHWPQVCETGDPGHQCKTSAWSPKLNPDVHTLHFLEKISYEPEKEKKVGNVSLCLTACRTTR